MSGDELSRLLATTVNRLGPRRRTFTEDEALAEVWQAGYDVSAGGDPRFVLAREADGRHPRQWRLAEQALANDRLLDALRAGLWDGRELDGQLDRLEAEDGLHYAFCPLDPRFSLGPAGALEAADEERDVELPAAVRTELAALGARLLDEWRAAGPEPRTVRQLAEALGALGWLPAEEREGWLLVRAWLLEWPAVVRVGADFWVPADALPAAPARTRLQVLPIRSEAGPDEPAAPGNRDEAAIETQPAPLAEEGVIPAGRLSPGVAAWTIALRTVHLVEGFLPVPADARPAYPPRSVGEGELTVVRGLWFEDGVRFWLWLDRSHDRLGGPGLADRLAWCDAGDLLRVEWATDVVVLRIAGHDNVVQAEEARLVDAEALGALRGGIGESYRRSLQAILVAAPDGLPFAELVAALRERQGHEVNRGTVRALLSAGGFVRRDGRWFAAPHSDEAARHLRTAMVLTLVPAEQPDAPVPTPAPHERLRDVAQAVRSRLSELISRLRS